MINLIESHFRYFYNNYILHYYDSQTISIHHRKFVTNEKTLNYINLYIFHCIGIDSKTRRQTTLIEHKVMYTSANRRIGITV